MSNIGGLSASAIATRLENQFALATLNFDFSLVKIDAPKEFHQFGQSLSPWRRKRAEIGSAHRTARKLGALFDQVVNPGKALVEAYGQRVSEISSSEVAAFNRNAQSRLFKNQAGADGTAIWAAATSGQAAIAVVLLTCMLARMWDAPKAVSIWVELIEKRKLQIEETCNGSEPSHLAPLAAAQQTITRNEISEWDASARAWLATADKVMEAQHQRVEFVLFQLSLAVDNSSDVFESVIRAWNTSMATMDRLIQGIPQRVYNSAVLIAIFAWHLYPDIELFGRITKSSIQRDALVRSGGCLTVGLEDDDLERGQGVYWSLSLASLRFYGDPVFATQHAKDESRVPFVDLALTTLGSILASWECSSFDAAFDLLEGANVWDLARNPHSWLNLLCGASLTLLDEDQLRAKRSRGLVSLGVRRGSMFVQPLEQKAPACFGLADLNTLLQLQTDDDARIEFLRAIASKMNLASNHSKAIIRYLNHSTKRVEYASVLPIQRGQKRDHEGNNRFDSRHVRWICNEESFGRCSCMDAPHQCNNTRQAQVKEMGEEYREFNNNDVVIDTEENSINWYNPNQKPLANQVADREKQNNASEECEFTANSYHMNRLRGEHYELLLGILDVAAIYVIQEPIESRNEFDRKQSTMALPMLEIANMLFSSKVSSTSLVRHMVETFSITPERGQTDSNEPFCFARSMEAFSSAALVYEQLPGSTIALRVLEQNLWRAAWLPSIDFRTSPFRPCRLNMMQTFSCVSMFESGNLNIPPIELKNVFAMSAGNSIYASARLVMDPHEKCEESELRRIIGNVGKAGLTMLIPPANPVLRKPALETWEMINHDLFTADSVCEDHFANTSVHLSFTGYEQPVPSAVCHGDQDVTACYLETIVSIFDGGRKVGDIDILRALQDVRLFRMPVKRNCMHERTSQKPPRWTILDSWVELLELSGPRIGIVRAHTNPLARLAATVASIQMGFERCIVLSEECCYLCAFDFMSDLSSKQQQV
ncbi:hypothetical protein BJ166DRAFT_553179, partial [Pestalotiopsis sp. NC0098]